MSKIPSTAIIIFGRSAESEVVEKNWHKGLGHNTAKATAKILRSSAIQEAKQTGLPIILFEEKLQKGLCFGERLASAFEHAFELGYTNTVAVGTDIPELKAEHILAAIAALNNGKVVLGPDKNGGTYLLGLTKSQFKRKAFVELSWCSDRLLSDLLRYLKEYHFSHKELIALEDLNHLSDIFSFLYTSHGLLADRLRAIICLRRGSFTLYNATSAEQRRIERSILRGPPSVHLSAA